MASQEQTQKKQIHVLLADDEFINRRMLSSVLEQHEMTVAIAENGEEAVTLFKQEKFQVILMDLQMPVMDGFTATRTIQKFEQENQLPHTPVIALTGHTDGGYEEKCRAAGMDAFITKPIDVMKLAQLVKEQAR